MAATFDVMAVLGRSGPERDAFCVERGGDADDRELIRAVVAACAAPGRERAPVDALADLAAVVRALGACVEGAVTVAELRASFPLLRAATGDFARLGPTRAMVRTVGELLADESLPEGRVGRQVAKLHELLEGDLADQLGVRSVGEQPPPRSSDRPREQWRLPADTPLVEELDAFVDELLDESSGALRRVAWVRGWSAVPVLATAFGEDDAAPARLARALGGLGARELLQVKLMRPSPYEVTGRTVRVTPGHRRCYAFPADEAGATAALGGDRGVCAFTCEALPFVVLEREDHHVVAGPRAVVEEVCGEPVTTVLASFRAAVEELVADDDEPPEHLVEAVRRYGHGRRRSV